MPFAIRCLMYIMACSQLDLSHAINVVSKSISNFGKEHWQAINFIMRYSRGHIRLQCHVLRRTQSCS